MRTTEKLRQGWLWPARERRADPRRPALPQSHGRAAPAWEGASHTGLTYGYAPYIVPLARGWPRQVSPACAAPAPWRICQSQRLSASRALHSAFSGRTKRARARRLPPAESRALLRTAAAVLRSALVAQIPWCSPLADPMRHASNRGRRCGRSNARSGRWCSRCTCCAPASAPRRAHGSRSPHLCGMSVAYDVVCALMCACFRAAETAAWCRLRAPCAAHDASRSGMLPHQTRVSVKARQCIDSSARSAGGCIVLRMIRSEHAFHQRTHRRLFSCAGNPATAAALPSPATSGGPCTSRPCPARRETRWWARLAGPPQSECTSRNRRQSDLAPSEKRFRLCTA